MIKKTGLASDGVTPVSGYADPGLVIAKVNISEAISRLPHVEIDAYSGSSTYTHKDLRGFLGTAAYVELLRDGAHCRSIIGIISGVTHCGVVGNLNGIPIHRYKFTVDSALINMKYVRRTRSFIGKSAKDVLETMLKNDYGMQYSLCLGCTEVVQTNDTSGQQTIASIQTQMTKALDYYQREESDYDFLLRILAENGLSFRVGTGASASQTSTGGTTSSSGSSPDSAKDSEYEKIFISSGDNYFTTSDDFNKNSGTLSNQEQTVDAKGTSYDYTFDPANGVIKLVNFEMMNCLGVDSVIQAESDRSDSSKREWLLNGSGMALLPSDNEDSQNQMKSVQADYLKRAFIMEQSGWNGVTNSPVVQPGTVINMLDFYGQENSENIKSRVLTMEDVLYEKLPDGYPVSSDASDDISMSFRSLEYGGEDAVTPSASVGELRQSFCRSGSNICMAVVCSNADKDKDAATANTVCTLEAQENKSGMFFYARLDGATNPVRVRFSMPIGGNSQGLYRLPRIGEQIQVTDAGNGNYLLVGYLPGREKMPFANTDGSSDMTKQMTALRHNTIAVIPSYSDDGADKPDPVKYSDLPYSEIGMYSEQGEDYTRIQSAGYRYDHTKKDYISTAENFLFASPSDDTDTISSTNRQFHVLDFEKV